MDVLLADGREHTATCRSSVTQRTLFKGLIVAAHRSGKVAPTCTAEGIVFFFFLSLHPEKHYLITPTRTPTPTCTHSFRPLDLGCYASGSKGCTKVSVCLFDESRRYPPPPPPPHWPTRALFVCMCVMMINTFVLKANRELSCTCISPCVCVCACTSSLCVSLITRLPPSGCAVCVHQ